MCTDNIRVELVEYTKIKLSKDKGNTTIDEIRHQNILKINQLKFNSNSNSKSIKIHIKMELAIPKHCKDTCKNTHIGKNQPYTTN